MTKDYYISAFFAEKLEELTDNGLTRHIRKRQRKKLVPPDPKDSLNWLRRSEPSFPKPSVRVLSRTGYVHAMGWSDEDLVEAVEWLKEHRAEKA